MYSEQCVGTHAISNGRMGQLQILLTVLVVIIVLQTIAIVTEFPSGHDEWLSSLVRIGVSDM